MQGFGVHTSMWTMNWNREGAEKAIAASVGYGMDFIEIALSERAGGRCRAHSRASRKTQSAGGVFARPAGARMGLGASRGGDRPS